MHDELSAQLEDAVRRWMNLREEKRAVTKEFNDGIRAIEEEIERVMERLAGSKHQPDLPFERQETAADGPAASEQSGHAQAEHERAPSEDVQLAEMQVDGETIYRDEPDVEREVVGHQEAGSDAKDRTSLEAEIAGEAASDGENGEQPPRPRCVLCGREAFWDPDVGRWVHDAGHVPDFTPRSIGTEERARVLDGISRQLEYWRERDIERHTIASIS